MKTTRGLTLTALVLMTAACEDVPTLTTGPRDRVE